MSFTRRSALGQLAAISTAVVAGCRTYTGDGVVRVATPLFPPGLGDPFMGLTLPTTLVLDAIYDSLTELGPEGTALPRLATAWLQISALRWRFELRDDASFSSGRPVSPSAIVQAIGLLRAPRGARSSAGTDLAMIESAEVAGGRSVDMILSSPVPLLPAALSVFRIPDPVAYLEASFEQFVQHPVGSGPYQVVNWRSGSIRLRARPDAWRRARASDLEVVLTTDQTARLQAVLSGTVAAAIDVSPDDAAVLSANGSRLAPRMTTSVALLAFVTTAPGPLQSIEVRRALNMAVNRQRLIDVFLRGQTAPAYQLASGDSFGRDATLQPIPYDPAAAAALIRDAGYPNGLQLTLVAVVGRAANDAAIYQQIGIELREIGVELRIRRVAAATHNQHLYHGDWPGDMFAIRMGGFDALRSFRLASCEWPAPWHCFPAVEAAVGHAQAAGELSARQQLTRAAVRADRATYSCLYLWQEPAFDALGPGVVAWEASRASIRLESLSVQAGS